VNGRALHFYLAGINNQNFLMRDKETGTWWQQITGTAIYGPLKGSSLDLVPYDELTFGQWKSEVSDGQVLAEVPKYAKKYESNWEPDVAKLPVVISFPGTELKSRDLVVGLALDGASRAYPWENAREAITGSRSSRGHAATGRSSARQEVLPRIRQSHRRQGCRVLSEG